MFRKGQRWRRRNGDSTMILNVDSDGVFPIKTNLGKNGDYYHRTDGTSCINEDRRDLVELLDDPSWIPPHLDSGEIAATRKVVPAHADGCECSRDRFRFMFHERWCPEFRHAFDLRAEAATAEVDHRTVADRRGVPT